MKKLLLTLFYILSFSIFADCGPSIELLEQLNRALEPNQYIFFRYGDVSYEGRVVSMGNSDQGHYIQVQVGENESIYVYTNYLDASSVAVRDVRYAHVASIADSTRGTIALMTPSSVGQRISLRTYDGREIEGIYRGHGGNNQIMVDMGGGRVQLLQFNEVDKARVRITPQTPPAAPVVAPRVPRLDQAQYIDFNQIFDQPVTIAQLSPGELVLIRSNNGESIIGNFSGRSLEGDIYIASLSGEPTLYRASDIDTNSIRRSSAIVGRQSSATRSEVARESVADSARRIFGNRPAILAGNISDARPPVVMMRKGVYYPRPPVVMDVVYHMEDIQIARAQGRIFDDVSPADLAPGSYTYVIMPDGSVSFGRVNDGWEVGVKHFQLARGRRVASAGELHIRPDGSYDWNTNSGTFSSHLVGATGGRAQITNVDLNRSTDEFFQAQLGRPGAFSGMALLPLNTPRVEDLMDMCGSRSFVRMNPDLVQMMQLNGVPCF